jgi:hypothetical protein
VHKYERLEKIYYKKKYLRIFFIIVIFIILSFVAVNFIFNIEKKSNVKNNYKKPKITKTETNISETQIIQAEQNITKNHNDVNQTLTVDTNQTEKNLTKIKISKNDKNISKDNIPLLTFTFTMPKIDLNITKADKKTDIKKSKSDNKPKKIKTKKLSVIIEENININDLIKNFNNHPSFDMAIQISEYYLNKNYLNLAKKWALKANSINPERYESWKIFAIILIRKNEKEKAKEVLKTYLNDYGENNEIKKILRSIDE